MIAPDLKPPETAVPDIYITDPATGEKKPRPESSSILDDAAADQKPE